MDMTEGNSAFMTMKRTSTLTVVHLWCLLLRIEWDVDHGCFSGNQLVGLNVHFWRKTSIRVVTAIAVAVIDAREYAMFGSDSDSSIDRYYS